MSACARARRLRLGLRGLCLMLVLAGCATPSEQALRGKLKQAASSLRGGERAVVVPIYADSRMAAWTLMAEARSGESPLERQLGNRLAHLATRRFDSLYDSLVRRLIAGIEADLTE